MRLTAFLGCPVVRDGMRIGEVADLGAAPGNGVPVVTGVVVARRRAPSVWVSWRAVEHVGPDGVTVAADAALEPVSAPVLLRRDVLDAQIVDLAGRRVVRVGDIDLRPAGKVMHVESVETGLDSVLRRLGLRRLSRRAARRRISWADLHLPAHPGAALSLARDVPVVHRPPRFPTHVARRRRPHP